MCLISCLPSLTLPEGLLAICPFSFLGDGGWKPQRGTSTALTPVTTRHLSVMLPFNFHCSCFVQLIFIILPNIPLFPISIKMIRGRVRPEKELVWLLNIPELNLLKKLIQRTMSWYLDPLLNTFRQWIYIRYSWIPWKWVLVFVQIVINITTSTKVKFSI